MTKRFVSLKDSLVRMGGWGSASIGLEGVKEVLWGSLVLMAVPWVVFRSFLGLRESL